MPHIGELVALMYEAGTPEYAQQYDYVSATTSYLGEALPGSLTSDARWRIKLLTITGPDVATTWANGNSAFSNIWDNHLSLSYS